MAMLNGVFPLSASLRDAVFLPTTISEIDDLTPRMRRIRLSGSKLQNLKWTPGQHIRSQVAGFRESIRRLRPRDVLRTYSIYDADPDVGTLDLAMFDHGGDGDTPTPARRWVTDIAVGDDVRISRPEGDFVVRPDARYHIFAGDETASVAFAAMLRALPPSAEVYGVIEGATAADHLPLARPLRHVERGDRSAASSTVLADALRALPWPDHPGFAYLAGEARTVQALRTILVAERGWDRHSIRTKPFWTPGRRGMD